MKLNKITEMIIVLTVIGLISGGVLSLVYQWSLPKIEANQQRETRAAIFSVLPGTYTYKKVTKGELTYFNCYDKEGGRIGIAMLCQGNGYQGAIKLMIGINADFTKFTGLKVLEQLETPGLGARIAETWFTNQFKGLAARPPIEYVKGRAPEQAHEIKAIAGATISTRAVVNIINNQVEEWLKLK